MAAYSFSSFVLLSIYVTFYLLLLSSNKVNSAEITSFDFSKFHSGQKNLILQGDTGNDDLNGCLVLIREKEGYPVQNSVGRVLYEIPIHLWDNQINKEASFETSFTFYIATLEGGDGDKGGGDGITFFLAPMDTQPKPSGGLLGIFQDVESIEPVVAVEFDTFSNEWDPVGSHIGIDIRSIKSRITTPWTIEKDFVTVTIIYDAPALSLSVSYFYYKNPTEVFTVKENVRLRDALPEWVRVGLSASTGDLVEQHLLYSWSFKSELPLDSSTTLGFNNTNLVTNYVQQA